MTSLSRRDLIRMAVALTAAGVFTRYRAMAAPNVNRVKRMAKSTGDEFYGKFVFVPIYARDPLAGFQVAVSYYMSYSSFTSVLLMYSGALTSPAEVHYVCFTCCAQCHNSSRRNAIRQQKIRQLPRLGAKRFRGPGSGSAQLRFSTIFVRAQDGYR